MVAAELQVVGGKHSGQVIPLNRKKFLIGREQDCQLRPNSDMVSRHHCVFSVDDFSVRLRDLGSTNGTLVNGERIRKEVVLNAGDKVVIGNLEFELSIKTDEKVAEVATDSDVAQTDETVVEATQTLHEVATTQPPAPEGDGVPTEDSQVSPADSQVPPAAAGTDSTQILPVQMMPGQVPYQPQMMAPQMGYPGMYGGYPYQPMMPGYGQMYPQMMPGVPGYPQAPNQQPQPPQQPAVDGTAPADAEVALPDPSTTGASDESAAKGSSGSNRDDSENPTGAADAIIKQLMNRRPNS
jgi:Inner membrane component of T3SS, cytoplasmic domain